MLKKLNFKKNVTLITAAIALGVTLLVLLLCKIKFISCIDGKIMGAIEDEIYGVFAAHVSLTFISISVLSMLSDKSNVIYWKDIVETRLIEPPFSCFSAYTTYSITTIVVSLIAIIVSNAILFAVGFLANIVVLVCLTKSMLDVYYKRDAIKKELKYILLNAYENIKKGQREEFDEIVFLFEAQIARAVANHDITYLDEVVELSIEHPELFEDTATQEILKIIGGSGYSGFFIDSCTRHLHANARKYIDEYRSNGNIPCIDWVNSKIDKALWLSYVNKNKQSFKGEDIILEDSLSALASKLKSRVAAFYNMLLPLWMKDAKIPNERIDDYYLIRLNGKITTKTKNILENELKIKEKEKSALNRKHSNITWYLIEKEVVSTTEDKNKEKFKEKEKKFNQYCEEYFNKTGEKATPEKLKEHIKNEIENIEKTKKEIEDRQKEIQKEFDVFAERIISYNDELFEFIYLMIYVLVEIYGERIKNESREEIANYERRRFKYLFSDFPFYKYFLEELPPDPFPEHREFIDFLAKS